MYREHTCMRPNILIDFHAPFYFQTKVLWLKEEIICIYLNMIMEQGWHSHGTQNFENTGLNKLSSLFVNLIPFLLRGHLRFNWWTYTLEIVRTSSESKASKDILKMLWKSSIYIWWNTALHIFQSLRGSFAIIIMDLFWFK